MRHLNFSDVSKHVIV